MYEIITDEKRASAYSTPGYLQASGKAYCGAVPEILQPPKTLYTMCSHHAKQMEEVLAFGLIILK